MAKTIRHILNSTQSRAFVLVLLLLVMAVSSLANDNSSEREYWQEFYVYRKFTEKIEGEILYNNFYNSRLGNYDWFIEGKLTYSLKSWLDMEFMYRHEFYDFEEKKVLESRPVLRLSGKKKMGLWNLRNRHRIEYRMFEIGGDHFRYRTDLKLSCDLNWTPLNFDPYVIEEVFVAKGMMTRNRVYAGIEGRRGRFEPALYVLLQSNNRINEWSNRIIWGIMLGIEI